jgi:hypothetical protein
LSSPFESESGSWTIVVDEAFTTQRSAGDALLVAFRFLPRPNTKAPR